MARDRAVVASPALLRSVFEQMQDGVIVADMQGRFLVFNPAAERLVGMGPVDSDPSAWSSTYGVYLEDGETPFPDAELPLNRALAGECVEEVQLVVRNATHQGGAQLVVSARPLLDADGQQIGGIVNFRDVTATHAMAAEMAFFASHDTLTGLLNRTAFENELAGALAGVNDRQTLGVMLIDLDRLKLINDTVGHASGDTALAEVARVIDAESRAQVIARLNGDEFALLLPGATPRSLSDEARRVLDAVCQLRLTLSGHTFTLSASAGATVVREPGQSVEEVMGLVSGACTDAKRDGRGGVRMDDGTPRHMTTSRAQMLDLLTLEEALGDDRLVLVLEPMRATQPGASSMAEALVRVIDADGVARRPGRYLVAAERFGRMKQIDICICEALLRHLDESPHSVQGRVSINLSADTVRDAAARRELMARLKAAPAVAASLTVEITETAALGDLTQAVGLIEQLKAAGCHVALDDFGAGFSNFAYLKHLPVDYLKIDGKLVRDMLRSTVDTAIVRSLITLCSTLRIGSVAEYVHSDALVSALTAMGADYLQGEAVSPAIDTGAVVRG